jgi:hypothetical protein
MTVALGGDAGALRALRLPDTPHPAGYPL